MNINKPPTAVTAQIKERKKKKRKKNTKGAWKTENISFIYQLCNYIGPCASKYQKKKKEKKEQQV